MNEANIHYPPELIEEYAKGFTEWQPEKLYRIRLNGKFICIKKGRSTWSTIGAAKNAFRAANRYGNLIRYYSHYGNEESCDNLFVKHRIAYVNDVSETTPYGQIRKTRKFIPYHDPDCSSDELYEHFIKYLIKEKILEFVEVNAGE